MSQLLVLIYYVQKAETKLEQKEEFLFCEIFQTTEAATDVMNLKKPFLKNMIFLLRKSDLRALTGHRLCLVVNRGL